MNDSSAAQFRRNTRGLLWGGLALSAILSAIAVLLRGEALFTDLLIPAQRWKLMPLCLALGVLTASISILLYEIFPALRRWFPREVLLMVRRLPLGVWLPLVLLGSLAEELCFRGALQPVLTLGHDNAAIAAGIVLTNVIFAFLHFMGRREFLGYGAAAFLAGILFSLAYRWTGLLWGAAAAHVMHNMGITVWVKTSKILTKKGGGR